MEDRFFYDDYIDDEIDRIIRENNRIKVFHLTTPIVFKSWFEKMKAKLKCMVLGHVWEYDGEFHTVVCGQMSGYRCKCCGKYKYFFTEPKSRKQ